MEWNNQFLPDALFNTFQSARSPIKPCKTTCPDRTAAIADESVAACRMSSYLPLLTHGRNEKNKAGMQD